MPSQRPSAAFDPIPPDLDLPALVEGSPNFKYVTRVSCELVEEHGSEDFEKLVLLHVIVGGKPLVIEGCHKRLDEWTFTSQWLQDNWGNKFEQARNLTKHTNMPLSINHYLRNMSKLADQWTGYNYREKDRQRIYLKDIDCPDLWRQKLEEQTPPSIFYLNESTGEVGGPGAENASSRGIARAGDLMSSLPSEMRAENLMCYIGHEGTYTPAHREMCASLGQNLMVETSGSVDEDGKPTKPGSSIWFMTESKDRHLVSEYWLSVLGHDIEIEKHFAQINAWKAAPFEVYIVEQKKGDFILIPPLAPHQVWNRGTRTMKVAWNRTTIETLEMALHEALPRARTVCRDEQYKNKAIVYFTLEKYSKLLEQTELRTKAARNPQEREELRHSIKIRQLQKDFKRLFRLFTEILLSEMLSLVSPHEKRGQFIPYDSFITCSYCRCNIFNRFLTCTSCIIPLPNGDEDTYDICLDCFAMGRSCACTSGYKWVEQFRWQDLVRKHEHWRYLIISLEGDQAGKSPNSLQAERDCLGKKTLAQVCQEQLRARPFSDPKNPRKTPSALRSNKKTQRSTSADEEDGDGKSGPKKKAPPRKDRLDKNYAIEHVSLYPKEKWKVAACSKCDRSYSYGSLWRMFDLMPITVMEDLAWECPFCLKICSCGACRRRTGIVPYEPKGTVLGHDTKKIADPRSVEHLVDFSHSNITWIKTAGDDHANGSRMLSRRIVEAEEARAQDAILDDHYVDSNDVNQQAVQSDPISEEQDVIPIDPMLSGEAHPNLNRPGTGATANGDMTRMSSSGDADVRRHLSPTKSGPPTSDPSHGKVAEGDILSSSREDRNRNFVSNGITYEYPDPEDSLHVNQTPAAAAPLPQATLPNGKDARKKPSTAILQSDTSAEAPNKAPKQSQNGQVQKTTCEAQVKNHSIITDAAKMAQNNPNEPDVGHFKEAPSQHSEQSAKDLNVAPSKVENDLLQSDLPTVDTHERKVKISKKRKRQEDEDPDFSVRKRGGCAPPNALSKSKTAQSINADTESGSETEEHEQVGKGEQTEKAKGPRPLPSYLANRDQDQQNVDQTSPSKPKQNSDSTITKDILSRPTGSLSKSAESTQQPTSSPATKPTTGPKSQPANGVIRSTSRKNVLDAESQRLAEENRQAKLRAVAWASERGQETESSDRSTTSDEDDPTPVAKKPAKAMAVPQSIFSRPGMAGRKIRIASAKTAALATKL